MAEYIRNGNGKTFQAEQMLIGRSIDTINAMLKEGKSSYHVEGISQYLYCGEHIVGTVYTGEWVVLHPDGYAAIVPNDYFRSSYTRKLDKKAMAEHVATLFKDHKIYWVYESDDPYDSERLSRCEKCGYINEDLHPENIVIEYVTNMLNDAKEKN